MLDMDRGEKGSRTQRLEHRQFKAVKQRELAQQKDLKAEIAQLREQLKEQQATREDYAKLEQLNRELKEQVRKKDLTIQELKEAIKAPKKQETISDLLEKDKNDLSTLLEQEGIEVKNYLIRSVIKWFIAKHQELRKYIEELLKENQELRQLSEEQSKDKNKNRSKSR
jgi:hypothetical protein